MVNQSHLRALLKKDGLTLARNLQFAICMFCIPIFTLGIFAYLKYVVKSELVEEKQHPETLFFTSTQGNDTQFNGNMKLYHQKYSCDRGYGFIRNPQCQDFLEQFSHTLAENDNFTDIRWFDSMKDFKNHPSFIEGDESDFCSAIQVESCMNNNYTIRLLCRWKECPVFKNPPYNPVIRTPDIYAYIKQNITAIMGQVSDISSSILALSNKTAKIEVLYGAMKTPKYHYIVSYMADQLQTNFPLFLMFTYLVPLYYLISKLSEEKENKAREGMKMMGLLDSVYYLSWLIFFAGLVLGISFVSAIVTMQNVFIQSSNLLFFCFCFLYGLTQYGFSFLIVSTVSNSKSSATAASLIHLASYCIGFFVQGQDVPLNTKLLASLVPNVSMVLGCQTLFNYEFQGKGLGWGDLMEMNQNFSFGYALLMFCVDFLWLTVAGLYCDQVLKQEFGKRKPWYFCLQKQYVCCCCKKKVHAGLTNRQKLVYNKNPHNFEDIPDQLQKQESNKECMFLRNIRKEFSADKIALHDINLNLYSGQIFALLGHNGAGKTTLISILTGLLEPTRGEGEVYGVNIFEEDQAFRKHLGVCPQHNILFEYLTAREHLELYAAFKNVPDEQKESEIERILKDINLGDVEGQMVRYMSGGEKRKLSVGIALIGDSKVVFLDEPTSGMDTSTRRQLWDMLKMNKKGKIIILTTHYMDEADVLGDRIAIMAEGRIKCIGSPLFLKNKFGVGYNLIIAKQNRSLSPAIEQFVTSQIPNSKKLSEVSSEILFQLPTEASASFKAFFLNLDSNLESLQISQYGVGITSLEEVFLKLASSGDDEEEELTGSDMLKQQRLAAAQRVNQSRESPTRHSNEFIDITNMLAGEQPNPNDASTTQSELEEEDITESLPALTLIQSASQEAILEPRKRTELETSSIKLFFTQLFALMHKKLAVQTRDPKTLFIEIIFPLILLMGGLAFTQIDLPKYVWEAPLSVDLFPQPHKIMINSQTPYRENAQSFFSEHFAPENWEVAGTYGPEEMDKDLLLPYQLMRLDNKLYSDTANTFYASYFFNRLDTLRNKYSAALFVNATAQDALSTYGVHLHEQFLRQTLNDSNLQLSIIQESFPFTLKEIKFIAYLKGLIVLVLLTISIMMVSASSMTALIRERELNQKHQMILSGAYISAYWISHYLVDMFFLGLPISMMIGAMFQFNLEMKQGWHLLIIFMFTNPIFIYTTSFLFKAEQAGSMFVRMFYLSVGGLCLVAVTLVKMSPPFLGIFQFGEYIQHYFYPFPIFALGMGLTNINNIVFTTLSKGDKWERYDMECGGMALYCLLGSFVMYSLPLIIIESRVLQDPILRVRQCLHKQIPKKQVINYNQLNMSQENQRIIEKFDEDIIAEENRIQLEQQNNCQSSVSVLKLNKTLKTHQNEDIVAVADVSFGLDAGECFALLGVSGAGKTTTFKCLTGELYPTSGVAMICGQNITTKQGFMKVRKNIGYCPQFDAIFIGYTVYEHLKFYASIKGILSEHIDQKVNEQIATMDLEAFRDVQANQLSGGNKRKLSVGMALIGNPEIILLDEPSTGVDPKAKRFMWSVISGISTQNKNSAVILTTNQMEEAEALSTKMGIMAHGRFKCFGSTQHIKGKYGTGYEVQIKIRNQKQEEIQEIIATNSFNEMINTVKELNAVMNAMETSYMFEEPSSPSKANLNRQNQLDLEVFISALNKGVPAKTSDVIRWVFQTKKGNEAIEILLTSFKQVEILEHYNNFYKLKIEKNSFSIGFLFGLLEEIKYDCGISEYSVQQTTLEQIFNNFASGKGGAMLKKSQEFKLKMNNVVDNNKKKD